MTPSLIELARHDVNTFIELVGGHGTQPAVHTEIQRLVGRHDRLIMMPSSGLGVTTQLVLRMVWEIGRDPTTHVLVVGKNKNREGTGAMIVKRIRDIIQSSPEVREIFPDLLPGDTWRENLFSVKQDARSKVPTVRLGSVGELYLGVRYNWVILDGWYDESSDASSRERARQTRWILTLADRMTADGHLVACCSLGAVPLQNMGWHAVSFPVYEPARYDADLDTVRLTLPELWPMERILRSREQMSKDEFVRRFLG